MVLEHGHRNPFVGPRAFETEDRAFFFGRDRETSDLLSLAIAHRMLLFHAQSGAGKTSILNAGLVPALEEEGFDVLSGRVAGPVPKGIDSNDITNLYVYNALVSCAGTAVRPKDFVRKSLAEFLQERTARRGAEAVAMPRAIILDQFEELLTVYPRHHHEREGFFEEMGRALQEDPLLRIVLVLREEYAPQLERYSRLVSGWSLMTYRMERLRRSPALQAIKGPLAQAGRSFDAGVAEGLVDDLLKVRVTRLTEEGTEVAEVAGEFVEPVQLQVVCHNLWAALPSDVPIVSFSDLSKFGDVDDALCQFYQDAIAAAVATTGVQERSLRSWCGEVLVTPLKTRGRVPRGHLETEGIPNSVVDLLVDEHLIRAEPWSGALWYELTHDRLIEPILDSNKQAESDWAQRDAARRQRLLISITLFLVLAGLLAGAVLWKAAEGRIARERAETAHQARIAESRQFAARVPAALARDPELGLLLAMEAISVTYSVDSSYTVEAYGALWQALDSPPYAILHGHTARVNWAAFGPDGQKIVTASADRTARVWDVHGVPLATLTGHSDAVNRACFSPDGKHLLTASDDSTARLWGEDGRQITQLSGHEGAVKDAVFSADGYLILTASADRTSRVWDIEGDCVAILTGHTGPVNSSVFSPDGELILTASADGTARLWHRQGTPVATLTGHTASVNHGEFSPDGRRVLTASADGTARLWDLTGRSIATLSGHMGSVIHASFSPDGQRIVTASADGTARVWDRDGLPVVILGEHLGPVNYAAFSPDGFFIVTASADGSVRLWHREGQRLGTLSDRSAEALHAEFSPNSQLVVTAKTTGAARLHYISVDQMMTLARSRVTRSLTAEELQTYGGDTLLVPTPKPAPSPTATSAPPSPTVAPTATPTPPPGMVLVPAGDFLMGSTDEDIDELFELCSTNIPDCKRESLEDQYPQRVVHLDSFYLDEYEVTNAQYGECVRGGACTEPENITSRSRLSYYGNPEYDQYPVLRVTWHDAQTYCEWAGKRLPTEAEWEKAARGTDARLYPWGNEVPGGSRLNYCDINCPWQPFRDLHGDDGYKDTSPAGAYPVGASPYGAYDMGGNVWEWVTDWYDADYYVSGPLSNPTGPSDGSERVIRGGSFENTWHVTSATYRSRAAPHVRADQLGFRCAAWPQATRPWR